MRKAEEAARRSPFGVAGDMTFTLRQDGERLAGTVEGGGRGFLSGPGIVEIEDGRVEGDAVSFRAGNVSYTGTQRGD